MALAIAALLVSCGDDADELTTSAEPARNESPRSERSGRTTITRDHDAGWVLTAEETSEGPCINFTSPVGGGENCGEGSMGSMNATIMPAEVRADLQAKSPVPIADALFEFEYVYGSVPPDVDLVRVNTSQGDRFETEVIRPKNSDYGYFVIDVPAASATLDTQLEALEFARRDRVDDAGDVIWTDSLRYLAGLE